METVFFKIFTWRTIYCWLRADTGNIKSTCCQKLSGVSMPEACTAPSYPIILSFNFEVNIITKPRSVSSSECECCMQGWQTFRQVVLRMWSPTCQQWPVSQESGRARDRLAATWDTLALVTSCMGTRGAALTSVTSSHYQDSDHWHPPGADMWHVTPSAQGCSDQWRRKMSPMLSESHSNKLLGILLLLLHIDVLQVECQKGFINFPVSNSEGNRSLKITGREVKVEGVLNVSALSSASLKMHSNPFCMHAQIPLICTCFNLICLFSCRMSWSCIINASI